MTFQMGWFNHHLAALNCLISKKKVVKEKPTLKKDFERYQQ